MRTRAFMQAAAAGMLLLAAGCAAIDPPLPAASVSRAEPAPTHDASAPAPEATSRREPPAADGAAYACDNGLTLHARFREDTLTLSGLGQGEETLLRDAGGVTPEQTVWSNDRVRAEFGLPPDGQGAVLHLLQPEASTLHCRHR